MDIVSQYKRQENSAKEDTPGTVQFYFKKYYREIRPRTIIRLQYHMADWISPQFSELFDWIIGFYIWNGVQWMHRSRIRTVRITFNTAKRSNIDIFEGDPGIGFGDVVIIGRSGTWTSYSSMS